MVQYRPFAFQLGGQYLPVWRAFKSHKRLPAIKIYQFLRGQHGPEYQDINPKEFKGERLHLSGIIFKEDGETPFKISWWKYGNATAKKIMIM